MKKWAVLGFIIIAVGGYAIKANAEGFYWGLNFSQYQPHTDVRFEPFVATLEKNENAETALALIVGYEMNKYLNFEGSYRTLKGFGYRTVMPSPGNQVATASYDVNIITLGNVVHLDNGLRPQAGFYQNTTDGTITAAANYGIPSGSKQSSEWGMYYGLGYEFKVKSKAVRLDALYFPTVGNQDLLGAEGDALMLGVTVLFK